MIQFRTKARAIELLGKGQIADLPTAISELWKNGYDAYADKLSCNLFLPGYGDINAPIFVLSDSGFGMSKNDILNKWIVLGTDSKARGMELLSSDSRFGLKQRIPMGEKGIGRLSVSYLGSPMLMLTKKKNMPCEAIFFDWRILENYNLFVDDVNIPMCEFSSSINILNLFDQLKEDLKENLYNEIAWEEQINLANEINRDTTEATLCKTLIEEILSTFLQESYHGTSFVIFKPHEQLLELANHQDDNSSDYTWEIRRSLGALFNIFADEPDFTTEFNIKNINGSYNIINDFFDKEDFKKCDHYIKGHFDENGFFEGSVRVYNQIHQYKFRPIRIPGKTPYGPFDLELGTLEGSQTNSRLTPEEYSLLDGKTSRFGGLYVYRDNFRVLPYGRVDYDFLKFEERRSKRMGEYFFRYNKMFGYLGITRENNRGLTDKAGREGFVENKAYREFKQDLISFFVDLAKTFLATPDQNSSNARSLQQEEIRKRNEKMVDVEKKNTLQARNAFMDDVKSKTTELLQLQKEIDELNKDLIKAANDIQLTYEKYKNLCDVLENKRQLLRRLKIRKPNRVTLTERQNGIYTNYTDCFDASMGLADKCLTQMDSMRKKFDVNDLKQEYANRQLAAIMNIGKAISTYKKQLQSFADKMTISFNDEQKNFQEQFKKEIAELYLQPTTNDDYRSAIASLVAEEEKIKDAIENRFTPFIHHLENLTLDIDDDVLMAWYKEQKAKVDEKLEFTTGLAQLGISVEIIDHELNVLYSQMASSIKNLNEYAKSHPELNDTYYQIRNAFEHMEQNYKMLKPLYRNVRRQRREFFGRDIINNIHTFFESKIKSLNVDISTNDEFERLSLFTFESEMLSVFINIVNNALYWVIPVENRKIRIEYDPDNNQILIMNNGEPIPDNELGKLFALFYTKRKDGRGIGLYLAQKSLSALGYSIFASNASQHNKLHGACFVINLNNKY